MQCTSKQALPWDWASLLSGAVESITLMIKSKGTLTRSTTITYCGNHRSNCGKNLRTELGILLAKVHSTQFPDMDNIEYQKLLAKALALPFADRLWLANKLVSTLDGLEHHPEEDLDSSTDQNTTEK
jgi:hypothetical protein